MVEQRTENSCVAGSTPALGTIQCPLGQIGKVASLKRKSSLGSTPRGGTNKLTNNGICRIIETWVVNSVEEFWSSKPAVRGSNPLRPSNKALNKCRQ